MIYLAGFAGAYCASASSNMLWRTVYFLLPLLLSQSTELLVVARRVPGFPAQQGCQSPSLPRSNASSPMAFANDVLLSLRLRQEECLDPGWHICPNVPTKCAAPGYFCCNAEYSCKNSEECVGNFECCPRNTGICGQLCCEIGSRCCNNKEWCCAAEDTCCDDPDIQCCRENSFCCSKAQGCCPDGDLCCPGACCPKGSVCAGNGECEIFEATLSTPRASPTSRTSSKTEEPPEETEPPDFPDLSSSSTTTTATIQSSAPTPTVTFIYVPGLTDEIVGNMCLGMRKRGKQNLDTLTYEPSGKPAKRQAAGCVTGFCNFRQTGKTCDEYPFASTREGGAGAQIGCVPWYQNNEQGTVLSTFRLETGLQPGQPFGVLIQGIDCSQVVSVAPPVRRSESEVTGAGYNATVLPPLSGGNSSLNHVLLNLGDLTAGHYSVSSLANANVDSLVILDGDGEQYAQSSNLASNDNQTVDIVIPDTDEIGVGITVFTRSQSLNITWYFNGTTSTVVANHGRKQQQQSIWQLWGALIGVGIVIGFQGW